MVIMHLPVMNQCQDELDHNLILRRGSGDSASAGELQVSPSGGPRGSGGCMRERPPVKVIPCPRCHSMYTKFCYYNNYSVNQPRHFCRNCQRYWTVGGTLRNVPVGGGSRKKVVGTVRQRMNDAGQQLPQLLHELQGGGGLQLAEGSSLLNMTLQSNVLLPSTMQMASITQQQLSMLSQATTGGRLIGSSYRNQLQLLQSQPTLNMETPGSSNTTTTRKSSTQLPSFFQFSNMDSRTQLNGYNNNTGAKATATPANTTNIISLTSSNNQVTDHATAMSTERHSSAAMSTARHSAAGAAMYDLQPSNAANATNSSSIHGARFLLSNVAAGGFNNPSETPDGNHHHHHQMDFLSSVMHKPGYWGA